MNKIDTGMFWRIVNLIAVVISVFIMLSFMNVLPSFGEQIEEKDTIYVEDTRGPVLRPVADKVVVHDGQRHDPYRPYTRRFAEPIPLEIYKSVNPMGNLNANMIYLADQLKRNVDMQDVNLPIIVTSFQNLDNLKETNRLGRLIAESLIHEFQVRHWTVIDIRLVTDVIMNENGEFSLSRDIKKVKDLYNVGAIVTGTYSIAEDCIVVNARLMNINTGVVQSSGQVAIPFGGIESLLQRYTQPKTMKIKGESFEK
ncbi:MAG: hypothetical protein HQL05_03145 [Nitrospirae bacterium]|uniref:FlgO family outer membrane protein n=1 Tax=Candidatus Magnetobacterium casense TaxID=1455061 RepID=UPI000698C602|nr:FlgO family outer membrane protein [Candidatus Magnetobacterium casensis]MBF0336804.1 hypothetical protein [Nitrospirota bacterium]